MQGMQGAFDQNRVPLKVEDVGAIIKPFLINYLLCQDLNGLTKRKKRSFLYF